VGDWWRRRLIYAIALQRHLNTIRERPLVCAIEIVHDPTTVSLSTKGRDKGSGLCLPCRCQLALFPAPSEYRRHSQEQDIVSPMSLET
jgi:hypothetical protein